jgi:predicted transcriptional regulator
MPPTTLKLSPELKRRIQAVVKGTGQSAHAFMVDAIERETQLAEDRKNFVAAALEARDDFDRTGLGFRATDVHKHLKALAAGRATKRPRAIRWRR